ncbi:MAG TPA: universal stress protein [Methylomirabilota bacterium]|nr:universal stress protein [Methylomirabilota bacterium]
MFQRILCGSDFSDTAEAAWDVACGMARTHRAELILLHVFSEMSSYPDVAVAEVQRVWEAQRLWVQQALDQRVAAAQARGLDAHPLLKTGVAAETIADTAAEKGADLLVIGTHGRTGLTRLVIGSVAERVLRLAPCPVLIVKPRAAAASAAARAA